MKWIDSALFKLQRLIFYFQYLFFRLLVLMVNSLSSLATYRFAEIIGSLLFLRWRRRQFSIDNLHKAFPQKSEEEVRRIGRQSMQGIVKVLFEFVRIPSISKNPERYIDIQGEEHVWEALRGGQGLILATSHFGNWELSGIAAAAKGFPLHAIGKPNKNPFITDFIKRLRGSTGLKTIDQQGAVRKSIQLLKQNQVVAMLIDEHAKKGEVWVNLFGQKAATSALPAMLAVKYNIPVIPTFFYREKNKRALLTFEKPFPLKKTGDYQSDIQANTEQYMRRLQEELLKRPEDWTLWMHNRWRWADFEETTSWK